MTAHQLEHPNLTTDEMKWLTYLAQKPQLTQEEANYWQYLINKRSQMPIVPQQQSQMPQSKKKPSVKKAAKKSAKSTTDTWELVFAIIGVFIICWIIIQTALLK